MTGNRRNLLFALYVAFLVGVLLLFTESGRPIGTLLVLVGVLGVVGVSVTGRDDD